MITQLLLYAETYLFSGGHTWEQMVMSLLSN